MPRTAALTISLLLACGEPAEDRGPGAVADSAPGDLVLPPSAGAPRPAAPGHAPDTLRPEGIEWQDTLGGFEADTHRHLSPAELDVDSIAATYRNHYRSEYVDHHELEAGEPDLRLDAEVVTAAQRRTALQFGYVESDAWEHLLADMTEAQRRELSRRIEVFHRELGGP